MIVAYTRQTAPGVAVVVTGPALLAPGGEATGRLHAAFLDAAHAAGQAAVATSQASYSPQDIREGWGLEVGTEAGAFTLDVTQSSPLWTWVEFPTAPHTITAHGGVLHWTDGGGDYYARTVHHPGTPGKHRLPAQEAALLKGFTQAVDTRLRTLLGAD